MWRLIGGALLVFGVTGLLYNWIFEQREKQKRLEKIILFLQKSIYDMETEKIKVIDYFAKQEFKVLKEISNRLSTNTYPNGQSVWEEVFEEEKQNLSFDKETFQIILQAGNGFFGRSRDENISFLKKSLKELEVQQANIKAKDAQERKVWVPVGMLGAVMIVIVFL